MIASYQASFLLFTMLAGKYWQWSYGVTHLNVQAGHPHHGAGHAQRGYEGAVPG